MLKAANVIGVIALAHAAYSVSNAIGQTTALNETRSVTAELEVDEVAYVLIDSLNLRVEPSQSADRIRRLDAGEKLRVLMIEDDWARVQTYVSDAIGWVYTDYIGRLPAAEA